MEVFTLDASNIKEIARKFACSRLAWIGPIGSVRKTLGQHYVVRVVLKVHVCVCVCVHAFGITPIAQNAKEHCHTLTLTFGVDWAYMAQLTCFCDDPAEDDVGFVSDEDDGDGAGHGGGDLLREATRLPEGVRVRHAVHQHVRVHVRLRYCFLRNNTSHRLSQPGLRFYFFFFWFVLVNGK